MLPIVLAGGALVGGATAYCTYHLGEALALPSGVKEAPAKTGLSMTLGSLGAIVAYKAQGEVLNRHFSHLMTYEVPSKVEHWGYRDFLRVMGPLISSRIVMASTSVAVYGFVATKIDVTRSQ